MGTMIKSKDQYLAAGILNQSQSKKKDLKQREKEKKESSSESSSSTDGSLRYRKRRNKRETTTCDYCIVSHIYIDLFRNKMDIMTNLLEENRIALPEFAKRWERKQGNGKDENELGAWVKPNYVFSIFDSHSYISEPETSIPSLKKFPVNSSKLPPKTSHFSLDFDVPYERYSQIHSYISIYYSEYDI